jgi:hypothetical protein
MTDVLDRPVVTGPQRDLPRAHQGTTSASTLPLRWFLAATLLGAGAVHLAVAPPHFGESTLLGAGFIASAWVQIALAGAVVVRPTRWVLLVTVFASLVFIAVWAVSRTAGLPLGGEAGQSEAVTLVDGACVALEAIAAVVATVLIAGPLKRVTARVPALIAVFGALAVTTAAIASPSARDHADHGSAGGTATTGSGVSLNGQHIHGVKAQDVATETQPDQPLNPSTRAVLAQQLVEARAVAMRYPTVSDATAAGYRLAGGFAPGSGAHYISYSGLTGPGPFDPGRPLALIYGGTSQSSQVIGLMYYAVGSSPPEGFAGPNDHWHRHSNVCIKFGQGGVQVPLPVDADVTAAQCAGVHGYLMRVTGWMVHAWVVPSWESPLGVFSHDNPDVRCADGTYRTTRAGFCQGT